MLAVATVTLRDSTGRLRRLAPGDIIGRMPTAGLVIAHPEVSEAHAMISLRGRELRLLCLRGSVLVDGRDDDDFPLTTGQALDIAGNPFFVVEVSVPDRLLALRVGSLPPRELCAGVYSLVTSPEPDLVPQFLADSPLWVWATGEGWRVSGSGTTTALSEHSTWVVDGIVVAACTIAVEDRGERGTIRTAAGTPLTIVARHTCIHVARQGRATHVVNGLPGRIASEMVVAGVPMPWLSVAREVWRDVPDETQLRTLWDRTTRRLRGKLREGDVRDDLFRADGRGNTELFLYAGDRIRDET